MRLPIADSGSALNPPGLQNMFASHAQSRPHLARHANFLGCPVKLKRPGPERLKMGDLQGVGDDVLAEQGLHNFGAAGAHRDKDHTSCRAKLWTPCDCT